MTKSVAPPFRACPERSQGAARARTAAPPFRACPESAVAGEEVARADPACGTGTMSIADRSAEAEAETSSVKNLPASCHTAKMSPLSVPFNLRPQK
jgi:hypothetical protein